MKDIFFIILICVFAFFTALLVNKNFDLYFVDYLIKSLVSFAFFMLMMYSVYRDSVVMLDNNDYKRNEFYRVLSILYGFLAILLFIKSIVFYGDLSSSTSINLALEVRNNIMLINGIYYIVEVGSLIYIINRYAYKREISLKILISIIIISGIFMLIAIFYNEGIIALIIDVFLQLRSSIILVGYTLLIMYIHLYDEVFDNSEKNFFSIYFILKMSYYLMITIGGSSISVIMFLIIEITFIVSQYAIIKYMFLELLIKPYERINSKQRDLLIWQETVLKNIPDGVVLRQGKKVFYANDTFKNIFKISTDEDIIGKNIYEIFTNDDIKYMKQLEADLNRNNHILSKPHKYTLKDSTIIDVEESGMLLPYGERDIYFFICRDLKDRINYENMLLTLKQKEKEEKIKNEFISNISHELKTPLNVIYAATQMQDANYNNNKFIENKKYTKSIKQNCLRLIRLINNIIDVTKIEGGYYNIIPKVVNIVEEVEKITDSIVDYAKSKGLEVVFDTVDEEIYCYCDEDSVERIVLNLISNAIKYNSKNGKIRVIIDKDDQYAHIKIQDTGRGISKENLQTIYNRFERLDDSLSRNAEGSGIGLNITKSIVELNNGIIDAESEVDKGTTIIVKLPLKKDSNIQEDNIVESNEIKNNLIERIEVEFSDIYF